MRILLVDRGGYLTDFALRCLGCGHQVRMFIRQDEKTRYIARGLVDVIGDWHDYIRWADLIVLADNNLYTHEMDRLRQEHRLVVVGATKASAELELNRTLGMKVFQRSGIDTAPYREFSDYDSAIAYVKKEGRAFVSKPCGDEPDKSLSYVSKSPADLVYMLERWKKAKKLKGNFILQEKIKGIEMAVGGFVGPAGFAPGWCENWEYKRLMNGDLGVNCFTPDAEVLTKAGWKLWPDVTMADEICTLKDGKIVYDRPLRVVVGDFDGDLIGWRSGTVDILVTPNHNMYVQDDHYRQPFDFEPAVMTADLKRKIPRTGGSWGGVGGDPAHAALVGAYIADGYCKDRSIVFGNCPPRKREKFTAIAAADGRRAELYGRDLYVNSKGMADELRGLGLAHQKHIPQWIKDGSADVMAAFLDGYAAGDGSRRKCNLILTTVSPQLADDIQEICLKIGKVATISARDRRGGVHLVDGIQCRNTRICYDISISNRPKATLKPAICYRERYVGRVYCVTVPSHIIYARRNGKPCWIGQTGEQGTVVRVVSRSKLADKVLRPIEAELVKRKHIGYWDVNCIIDEEGTPWPLEHTARFGYPTWNIQQALLMMDPAEFLFELAKGRTSRCWNIKDVAVGVVMSIPDYPYSHITRKEVVGVPVLGVRDEDLPNIHPCEIMMGDTYRMVGDEIIKVPGWVTAGDYVLVASGVGPTVQAAREGSYRILSRLTETPSSVMYRTDIGQKLGRQLPDLNKMGYATGLSYATPR